MDLCSSRYGGVAINKLFDSETSVWALLGQMADVAVLSLLWTVCSIPLITIGASSAALMRSVLNMHTGNGNWRAGTYMHYFRNNLRNATLVWLVMLMVLSVFITDLLILSSASMISAKILRITAVLGMIVWMITAVWVFALTSLFENSLFQTIKNAFFLGISWLPRTILMSVLWLMPIALLVFIPNIMSRIVVLWPVLFFGGTAWICAKLMAAPLAPYYDHEDETQSSESVDLDESADD